MVSGEPRKRERPGFCHKALSAKGYARAGGHGEILWFEPESSGRESNHLEPSPRLWEPYVDLKTVVGIGARKARL